MTETDRTTEKDRLTDKDRITEKDRLTDKDRLTEKDRNTEQDRISAVEDGASGWKDHFSRVSNDYRLRRPRYPREFFEWLAGQGPSSSLAWDCATGNGQAAGGMAEFYARVIATDASAAQIAEAEPYANVRYEVAPAEQSPLEDASADAVTVAQALHWFDIPRFHEEVRRVLKPGGVIAEWTYSSSRVEQEIDNAVFVFSATTIGPYWPPERAMIDTAYSKVPFPFDKVEAPPFAMHASWDVDQFLGYLGTWSSVSNYRSAVGKDPLPELRQQLAPLWGDAPRDVSWPLLLRVGRA